MLFILLISLSLSNTYYGYLRTIEVSFCMDECGMYQIESEIDTGFGAIPIVINNDVDISFYLNRFVNITVGDQEFECEECNALLVDSISLSYDCDYPISCFADPCEVANECEINTPIECVSNFCGGCYADFYNLDGNLVDCYLENPPFICDNINGIDFGMCDMFLGYAVSNESCVGFSGCGWDLNGIDYSNVFFNSIEECESSCFIDMYDCEDIEYHYNQLHINDYALCEIDDDCIAVWGHCDVGLGGCHYSVNENNYPQQEINNLVVQWLDGDCTQGVCDCLDLPYAQCIDGVCTSAYCLEDNPAGCFSTGCDDGFTCMNLSDSCTPSSCFCNEDQFYGYWFCTEDCGGGTCIILGDINQDTFINITDIVSIVNSILIDNYNPIGDVNQDSLLNISDIIILVNIILGE